MLTDLDKRAADPQALGDILPLRRRSKNTRARTFSGTPLIRIADYCHTNSPGLLSSMALDRQCLAKNAPFVETVISPGNYVTI